MGFETLKNEIQEQLDFHHYRNSEVRKLYKSFFRAIESVTIESNTSNESSSDNNIGSEGFSNLGEIIVEAIRGVDHMNITSQMIHVYLLAVLNGTLKTMLYKTFLYKPNMMIASDEKISYKFAINCAQSSSMISSLAKEEANKFENLSFNKKLKQLRKKFGLELNISSATQSEIELAFQVRNSIIHNNPESINHEKLRDENSEYLQVHDYYIVVTPKFMFLTAKNSALIAEKLSKAIVEKFSQPS